ncbi:hypothetical protein CLIB1423_03S02784 [[Candida] railenensis]|uniref:Uncharacterized protein n=1 Tax=[Candida] railenensis TaxID=45579 RepID=A0A9P0QM86_9ASCO|nr:hypothetical protein CLIB1423_03S02784 [[Candida] railenensis]
MDVDFNVSQELNTPIKKIKNLTLTSPFQFSPPNLYPSLDDLGTEMSNKGYSRKLTNNVLDELNARASEISRYIKQPLTNTTNIGSSPTAQRRKRYSGIHRQKFNKMDSISSHYAAGRQHQQLHEHSQVVHQHQLPYHAVSHTSPPPMKRTEMYSPNRMRLDSEDKREPDEIMSSVTKRRRTLHGPEEVLPSLTQPGHNQSTAIDLEPDMHDVSSPFELNSSPIRKISPSKGSMNLNELLNDFTTKTNDISPTRLPMPVASRNQLMRSPTIKASSTTVRNLSTTSPVQPPQAAAASAQPKFMERQFLKPKPILRPQPLGSNSPSRVRVSSLEMAGVKSSSSNSISSLSKKPSTVSLNVPTSHTALKAPHGGSGIPVLSRKSSHSTLNHINNPTPTLQKKTSIPTLQKKTSIPKLASKPSIPRFDSLHPKPSPSSHSTTTPQPFSLYNRPTISSSQKSIETSAPHSTSTSQLKHKMSSSSLQPQKRTESRFSRFLNLGKEKQWA